MATKTLDVANRTLMASIVAILVGVVGIVVAIVDAINNRRQLNLLLRGPNLEVHISRLSDVVAGSDGGEPYYDLKVTFEVANVYGKTTSAADNVTVRLYFPEDITSTDEWQEQKRRGDESALASVVTGFSGWGVAQPLVRDPRWLITTDRLSVRPATTSFRGPLL